MLVAAFAALGALAYAAVFGETHHATRTPLDPLAIAKTYLGLIADRRFVVPAATVSLIMGSLFSVFSAAPRILIESMHFTPIQLGLFFAGTVLIVFAAGMLATRLAPRYGLDRSIRGGLLAAVTGGIAMLLVSLYSPNFLSYLGAVSVFLLGMGIVNPLGTAQALSPFGDKAGAASALVGFWQMMTAAIGVWLAATISHEALFALGVVLTVFSLAAIGLYTLRTKAAGAHEHEIGVGIAIVGDEAKLRLNVGNRPALEIFGDDKTEHRAADAVSTLPVGLRISQRSRKMTLRDLGRGHVPLPPRPIKLAAKMRALT